MAFASLAQQRKQLHYAIIRTPHVGSVTRGDGSRAQILIHSKISEEPSAFQYLGDAALDDLCGIEAVNALAVKKNGAAHNAGFVNGEEAGNSTHNGRFT